MLNTDQPQFTHADLSAPYAKLARHITAMYEINRQAPTNSPSEAGAPSVGLSLRERMAIAEHLHECMELICTLEKWMINPVVIVTPGQTGDRSREQV